MTLHSIERTLNFLGGQKVDRPPFHPIIMRFAARYAHIRYRDFCLDPLKKCEAMIRCADDLDLDWVTVMSDPYAEGDAFGLSIEYPADDLPKSKQLLLPDMEGINRVKVPRMKKALRQMNRIREIEEFVHQVGNRYFIVGWVEGPMAMLAVMRGMSNACTDLLMESERVEKLLEPIMENSLNFITAQVAAGAHCIGIGDAACSQIGPDLYHHYFFEREKLLVDHIHSLGALAKLHICGDTTPILPEMIRTGADIVDVDHLVINMAPFSNILSKSQVLCGNADPVSVVQNAEEMTIRRTVARCFDESGGRCITSAGCEITPDTSIPNLLAMRT